MNIQFDEENRIFHINDKPVPSVTQILPEMKYYCTQEELEAAREDGNDKHDLIRMFYDNNKEDFGDEYLIKYKKFLSIYENWGKLILWEKRLYSEKLMFVGKPDIVYENAIIDIKRNFINAKYHALQLVGYVLMLTENKICSPKNWFIVYLPTGAKEFQIKNVYDKKAIDIFIMLRRMYNMNRTVEQYFKS